MSNQNDEASDSPSPQESKDLPFKKRDFAEKTPPVSTNSDKDDFYFNMNEKLDPDQLQIQAYFNLLGTFRAESSSISSSRIMIINDLKKAWKIPTKTHNALEKKLKTDPLIKQLREVSLASDEKEEHEVAAEEANPLIRTIVNKEDLLNYQERLNAAPATMQEETPEPSSTSEASPASIPSWGKVSPASLVNKFISLRMPGEDKYVTHLIKEYDAKTETHHLVDVALSSKNLNDPCDWIDLRNIPPEDIVWQEGHPGFPTRSCSLKPGGTILNETSTSREKRQLKEVGKTASGIPIIKIVDKGKGIA